MKIFLVLFAVGCAAEKPRAGLSVGSGAARACEVLLADTGAQLDGVSFDKSVTGRWLRQGDKLAAAFASTGDAPISGGAVTVAYSGPAGGFQVLRSHCYDASGQELAGVTVGR